MVGHSVPRMFFCRASSARAAPAHGAAILRRNSGSISPPAWMDFSPISRTWACGAARLFSRSARRARLQGIKLGSELPHLLLEPLQARGRGGYGSLLDGRGTRLRLAAEQMRVACIAP